MELEACSWVFMNGEPVPAGRACLPVDTHALHYGTAAFESLRVYETPRGPCLLGLEYHLERLRLSLISLGVKGDYVGRAREAVLRAVEWNGLSEGYLRLLVYPVGDCGRLNHSAYPSDVLVIAWRAKGAREFPPLTLGVSSLRRPPAGSWLPRAKLSGFYATAAAAHISSRAQGYDDALLLHADGTVCEVTGANIFLVKDRRLLTPLTPHSISGVTRRLIFELAASMSLPVEQTPLPLEDFIAADEVFITGTFHGIRPVSAIDGVSLAGGAPGEICRSVRQRFERLLNNPDSGEGRAWLTAVTSPRQEGAAPPKPSYRVRPARSEDVPGVLTGVSALLSELRGVRDVRLPPGAETLCRDVIAGVSRGAVFVAAPAQEEGRVVGLLGLSIQEALHVGGRYALIQELWVHADYRSAGVGAALVEACENYCREGALHMIEVCLPAARFGGFVRTLKFYEACGFVELGPRMRKEVV